VTTSFADVHGQPEHVRRRFVKILLNLSKQGLSQKPKRSGTGLRSRQLQDKAGGVTPIGLFFFGG
jgi:hypothetical protein